MDGMDGWITVVNQCCARAEERGAVCFTLLSVRFGSVRLRVQQYVAAVVAVVAPGGLIGPRICTKGERPSIIQQATGVT